MINSRAHFVHMFLHWVTELALAGLKHGFCATYQPYWRSPSAWNHVDCGVCMLSEHVDLASLSACFHLFLFSGPRIQNWDLRKRPLGGNFTDNQNFRSKIINCSIQKPNVRKFNPRLFEYVLWIFTTVSYGKEIPCAHNPRVVQGGLQGLWGGIFGGLFGSCSVVFHAVLKVVWEDC